ncbi:MAG: chitobiase/beta-hexosaminidase C-terminal domain-containing protein [Eubacteriales bacterium]
MYKDSVVITGAVTVKAIAVAENYEQSEVSSFTYGFADQVEAPKTSYASGELEVGTEVEFSCETEGASIYYRTDGADPNLKEKDGLELYTGPVTVNRATTLDHGRKGRAAGQQGGDRRLHRAGARDHPEHG